MQNNWFNKLRSLVAQDILPHAILLSGNQDHTLMLAQNFAKWLLCEDLNKNTINYQSVKIYQEIYHCSCKMCKILVAQNHPDYLLFNLGLESIKIDLIREANSFVNSKPYLANKKVLVIHNLHNINHQAANAFLKTLEEPLLSNKVLILLTSNYPKMLMDTILSRVLQLNISVPLEQTNQEQLLSNSMQSEILQDLEQIWVKDNPNITVIVDKWQKLPKNQLIYTLWITMTNIIKARDPGILLQIKKNIPIRLLWQLLDCLNYINKVTISGQQINWQLFLYNLLLTKFAVHGENVYVGR